MQYVRNYGYVLVEVNDLDVDLTWMQRDTNDLLKTGIYESNKLWNFSAQPLILLSPNGGEKVVAGSVFNIIWKTYEGIIIDNVLEYSTDNSQNWNYIDAALNTGSYDWSVPIIDSSPCLVRVRDLNSPKASDTSYNVFLLTHQGDFEPDGDVDFSDFAVLAESWNSIKVRLNIILYVISRIPLMASLTVEIYLFSVATG